MSFKSWFKRRLGIHSVDGVEVVDLGNVDLERIMEFGLNEGSATPKGKLLSKDGRDMFVANNWQQFLVNDDGSMIALGIHAGTRVVIVKGGQRRWPFPWYRFLAIELWNLRPNYLGLSHLKPKSPLV